MARCNELGMGESRALRKSEKTVEQLKKLKVKPIVHLFSSELELHRHLGLLGWSEVNNIIFPKRKWLLHP